MPSLSLSTGLHQWYFVDRRVEEDVDWDAPANDHSPSREPQKCHGRNGQTIYDPETVKF